MPDDIFSKKVPHLTHYSRDEPFFMYTSLEEVLEIDAMYVIALILHPMYWNILMSANKE